MAVSLLDQALFMEIFKGSKSGYGQFRPAPPASSPPPKGGNEVKKKGQAITITQPLTEAQYTAHLNGEVGLGIVPINEEGKCNFAVIDIDTYDGTARGVLKSITRYGMPFVPFRSKSGGVHLYLFFSAPAPADKVVALMNMYKRALKLPAKTEVFPKQIKRTEDSIGNWINLPYFNGDTTMRYMLTTDAIDVAEPPTLHEALEYADLHRVTIEIAQEIYSQLPLNDAPPCLQAIYLSGSTEFRNNYMFSLARYFKAKLGENFEEEVYKANEQLLQPLPTTELVNTVINTHKKKDYVYKCSDAPICDLCDKNECKRRKWGIGSDFMSMLTFEEFIQVNTDPPYYEWKINGRWLKFYDEESIINQRKFREQVMRLLHILPNKVADPAWVAIVNNALSNVEVREVDASDDISAGGMFMKYLCEFLEYRRHADTIAQVLMRKVYKDEEAKQYLFKSEEFLAFLIDQKQFREFGKTEIFDRLRELGATTRRLYLDAKNDNCRVLALPYDAIKGIADDRGTVPEVTFEDSLDESNSDY